MGSDIVIFLECIFTLSACVRMTEHLTTIAMDRFSCARLTQSTMSHVGCGMQVANGNGSMCGEVKSTKSSKRKLASVVSHTTSEALTQIFESCKPQYFITF